MQSKIQNPKSKIGKLRGQSLVVIALCLMGLLLVVGLAVDGGALYGQRRVAQNAADAMAMAGAYQMLEYYDQMLVSSYPWVTNGSANEEQAILATIQNYTTRNSSEYVEAYFVNDQKQVVSVASNPYTNPECGTSVGIPCPVGLNRAVPWNLGATGITVKSRAQTDSFLMSIIGHDKLAASAVATGYMGRAVGIPNVTVFPIGVFTLTNGIENIINTLVGGRIYILALGDSRINIGNWGNLSYNGVEEADTREGWLECGYNPSLRNDADWDEFCPNESNGSSQTWGPTVYWSGALTPDSGPHTGYDLRAGPGQEGWWIDGTIGSTRDNCTDLAGLVNDIELGRQYLVPIIDRYEGSGGNNNEAKFHLRDLAWFSITRAEVNCSVLNDPENPLAGEHQTWVIIAQFLYKYSAGSTGQHGDIHNTSRRTVFLQP